MTGPVQVAGRLVAVPLGAVARWRRGKPIHPRGVVLDAVLERHGGRPSFGVPWLDAVGTDDVVVRMSRGAGFPAPLPDVLGLAIRMPGDDGTPVDILLSTTGRGPITRLIPVPRSGAAVTYSSIMAYRSAAGPVRIAAFPDVPALPSDPEPVAREAAEGGVVFRLAAAVGAGGGGRSPGCAPRGAAGPWTRRSASTPSATRRRVWRRPVPWRASVNPPTPPPGRSADRAEGDSPGRSAHPMESITCWCGGGWGRTVPLIGSNPGLGPDVEPHGGAVAALHRTRRRTAA
ncbi:hypothetical protein [Blastococcus saxobsidens]|uniref:Phosphodiesterase n=1 Tax=Blastococcus saxobsidens (strain DD2) TaxID=1146883 RepID=H6RRE1_BLASD|nr:hypothetical protein [Blastococcus saxobsidens]CCG05423.1 protein of unknown function [Blastococcus saxobsidens DD2]